MRIVVLDGYTLNPGGLSWEELESLGPCTVYERTSAEQRNWSWKTTFRLLRAAISFLMMAVSNTYDRSRLVNCSVKKRKRRRRRNREKCCGFGK